MCDLLWLAVFGPVILAARLLCWLLAGLLFLAVIWAGSWVAVALVTAVLA